MAHLPAGRLRRRKYFSSVLELFIINVLLKSSVRTVKAGDTEHQRQRMHVFFFFPPPLVAVATHLLDDVVYWYLQVSFPRQPPLIGF